MAEELHADLEKAAWAITECLDEFDEISHVVDDDGHLIFPDNDEKSWERPYEFFLDPLFLIDQELDKWRAAVLVAHASAILLPLHDTPQDNLGPICVVSARRGPRPRRRCGHPSWDQVTFEGYDPC